METEVDWVQDCLSSNRETTRWSLAIPRWQQRFRYASWLHRLGCSLLRRCQISHRTHPDQLSRNRPQIPYTPQRVSTLPMKRGASGTVKGATASLPECGSPRRRYPRRHSMRHKSRATRKSARRPIGSRNLQQQLLLNGKSAYRGAASAAPFLSKLPHDRLLLSRSSPGPMTVAAAARRSTRFSRTTWPLVSCPRDGSVPMACGWRWPPWR